MTAEVYHYYPNPIEDVFNAYARAIQDCFKVTGACYQYHTITFPLKFSFKYNMNGGNCTLNFIRHQDGTAVRVNYNIYQLIAALYDSHDRDMTLYVQRILGSFATPIFLSPMDFANPDNRVMSNGTTAAPNGAAYPPVSPNGAAYPPVSPNGAAYPPVSPNGAAYPPVSPNGAPYPPVSPNGAAYPPVAPNGAAYPPVSPNGAAYPPVAPNGAAYPPVAPNGAAYPPVSPNGAAYPPPMAPKEETATPGTPPPIRVAKGNYCIHCGSQQSSDTEFCQTCGKKRKN